MTKQTSSVSAETAVGVAKQRVQSGTTDYYRQCLRFVRECWHLPGYYPTARAQWLASEERHDYKGEDAIPYGAPVYSTRPNAPADDAGHVFIAGGYNKRGKRIYRMTDILVQGGISVVTMETFLNKWGHTVLGWASDLEQYHLNLPPPRGNKRR